MKNLSQIASHEIFLTNQITDGQMSCSYGDLSAIFDRIDGFMNRRLGRIEKAQTQTCILLDCENSLPSGLMLLYLLDRGYSVALIPLSKTTANLPTGRAKLPRFCRYVISTCSQPGSIHSDPSTFIELVENKESTETICDSQKIFLRTSGSTGQPKLVRHSARNLFRNVRNCVERLKLSGYDRVAIPVPLYHMYGLGAAFLPSVVAGASIDLQKGANLLRFLQRERNFEPTVAFTVPSFCETLSKGRRSKRNYRVSIAAGDTMSSASFARYEALMGPLVRLYGSTEMGAIAAASPDLPQPIRATSVGQPMPGVELRLTHVAHSSSEYNQGELWCRHQDGFEGYVDNSGQLLEMPDSVANGWFRTKDFAVIDEDGNLDVRGRCDHSVNRDGLLVFLSEVEGEIRKFEGVIDTAVVAEGQSSRGKGITAYCVLDSSSALTEAEIRTSCFDQLPKRAVPDSIVLVDALPQLSNGKVDRQQLLNMSNQKVHPISLEGGHHGKENCRTA